MTFNKWIDTFVSEKGIENTAIEVEGPSGINYMTVRNVVEAIKQASTPEKKSIKATLIMIDFKNGNAVHFFKHLAQAIAI